jgi:surface antigen
VVNVPGARSVLAYGRISATGACLKAAFLLAASLFVAGCSLTMPFESTRSASLLTDPDITGSIPQKADDAKQAGPGIVSIFFPKMDEEDFRRANSALVTAMDPQGNGGHVRWENNESHAKGSFAPIGNAYLVKDDICRVFVAMAAFKGPEEWVQGTACRTGPGTWAIKETKPWKKPG